MRAPILLWLQLSAIAALLPALGGCAKEVKAEFPRPPATATLPAPESEPEEAPPPPAPPEPEAATPVETSTVVDEDPPAPPDAPQPRPRPAPETPVVDEPEEPPSTNLVDPGEVDPELASKLDRASNLLGSISRRSLTSEQADQLVAARGFVSQARKALTEGDQRRALVLIDKGLLLAEDVERVSRP